MKVVVSIVNFNTKDLILNCLKSIFDRKKKNEIEVWVVDNASTDTSVEEIKKNFPKVNLIKNSTNLGFGAGHNIVLKKAKGDYFLILNSDCEILNSVIDEMVIFMESNTDCGVSSCKILGFDGRLQPNAGDLPLGPPLLNWLFNLEVLGVRESFHRNESAYYEDVREVGWVSGSFMVIRAGALKKIGQFSENYFMYFEDTEYCYRIKQAGYKIMINPKIVVKHLSGGSLDDPLLRQWSGEYKGLIIFYKQFFGVFAAFFIKLLVYLSIFLRIVAFGLKGNLKFSSTYAKIIFNI